MELTNEIDSTMGTYALNDRSTTIAPQTTVDSSGLAVRSPEWWAARLSQKVMDNYNHFATLQRYYEGTAKLPSVPAGAKQNYTEWQRRSRTNFAALVVTSVSNRISVRDFRNASGNSLTEDSSGYAWRMWRKNGLQYIANDIVDYMLTLGESYALITKDSYGETVTTAESPLWSAVEVDPANPNRILAYGKFIEDTIEGVLKFEVWLPGEKYTFEREVIDTSVKIDQYSIVSNGAINTIGRWSLNLNQSAPTLYRKEKDIFKLKEVPVVRFVNKDNTGEFERHIDLIDRINQTIFERTVITSEQAYRKNFFIQDAIKYDAGQPITEPALPDRDENDNPIDYSNLLSTGPGTVSLLPPGVKHEQGGTTDIQGLMMAEKQDVISLASATSTLVYSLLPDAANQSAGASDAAKEQFISKVEDRLERLRQPMERLMRILSIIEGRNEEDADLEVIFKKPTVTTLSAMADADSKVQSLPIRTRLSTIWGMEANEIEKVISEIETQKMLDAAFDFIPTATGTGQLETEGTVE